VPPGESSNGGLRGSWKQLIKASASTLTEKKMNCAGMTYSRFMPTEVILGINQVPRTRRSARPPTAGACTHKSILLLRRVAFPDFCEPCLPRFVFGVAVLATLLVAAPAAYAACRSPKNICKHFDDCLQRTSGSNNKDADGIRAGVKARNGQLVLAGAEACARDLGKKQQWDKWARPTILSTKLRLFPDHRGGEDWNLLSATHRV
jgi:hypothetical protein